jgi:dipeptidyl aminopeptidase/acylaminoacyl peptidase
VHADDDPSVPVVQADTFVDKLREVGAPHAYCRYDTGGHLHVSEPIFEQCQIFIKKIIDGTI